VLSPSYQIGNLKNSLDLYTRRTIINFSRQFISVKEFSLATAAAVPPVRVEIYDQVYNLRGTDAEYILKLAEFVDGKMRSVAEQTSTVDSLRLAVLAALNIADEYHLLKKKYDALASEYRQRAGLLAGALDEVLEEPRRAG
jgi:cell division protein ZapA